MIPKVRSAHGNLNGGSVEGHSGGGSNARVLFVVQPDERNTMDQRALEYALLAESHSARDFPRGRVTAIRASLKEINAHATKVKLVPTAATAAGEGAGGEDAVEVLFYKGFEISVVYFRAVSWWAIDMLSCWDVTR